MPGTGTLVNVCAIVAGGLIGCHAGRFFSTRMRDALMTTCGVLVVFIGIGGAMAQMLKVSGETLTAGGTMMMLFSLVFGTVIGNLCRIEERIAQFGIWLRNRTGNAKDQQFVGAFVSASLTVCVGAMAVIGAINDGISHDPTLLFTKAILDFSIILSMSAAMGIGTAFAAVPVGIVQGVITILAGLAAPILTGNAMDNLSYVGSILITCVGINLLFPEKIHVADMLPSLLIAVLWAFLPFA